ncbi:glycoside hydrolase family 32 protein [Amphibacillus sp. Q70]|uniref:glycoside hydrolase family 32 protein n=1 Tax=Amphibacillus sp. Q70 TaxID=3453416 RepID=UPI003F826849
MLHKEINKHRPRVHFSPKANWINDPNGMAYFEGEYHLFFQYNPKDTVWGPMHWGHAVSKDMIEWEELDIALFPDHLGQIFSGSAVVDWHNTTGFFPEKPGLVAIFTHHLPGVNGERDVQTQSLAYSHDRGRTWVKYEGNPVLTDPDLVDFRDPKVFWDPPRKRWIMVLATGQSVRFYSSQNLKDWQFESKFGDDVGYQAAVWECPDLFELPIEGTNQKKWTLFVSVGDNPQYNVGSKTHYFVGDFDGTTFVPDHKDIRWLDHGKDNYAGVSFSDIPTSDGRRIYMAWMSNWRYANQVPTAGWRGQMTFPRQLSLQTVDGEDVLKQSPVKEIEQHAQSVQTIEKKMIKSSESHQIELNGISMAIDLTFNITNTETFTLAFIDREEQPIIVKVNGATQEVTLQRQYNDKEDIPALFNQPQLMSIGTDSELNLRFILDASSIELFADDGLSVLTSLIYPNQPYQKLVITSEKGNLEIITGQISIL